MSVANRMIDHVEEYLAARRALGVQLTIAGGQLQGFARFLDAVAPGAALSVGLALRWAQESAGSSPTGPARRLEIVRPFARYMRSIDPETEIPPHRILGPAHRRIQPHIYSDQELHALLDATTRLIPLDGLRPLTMRTYLGLLVSTGMRPSEPLNLSNSDVDLNTGTLTIRKTKFSKSRLIALHPSVTHALCAYVSIRDHHLPRPQCSSFFLVDDGSAFTQRKALTAFNRLRNQLGWATQPGQRPVRLYDLRHSFVCRRLLAWYREGTDVHVEIAALSTYLGHAKVTDTYWYVSAIPELMAVAGSRFERFAATNTGVVS